MYVSIIDYIDYLVWLNGIYDISCALSIMRKMPMSQLHLGMFYSNPNPLFERFIAYWIFTYGMIRLSNHKHLIISSYLLEALFFTNECFYPTIDKKKAIFVATTSTFVATCLFCRQFVQHSA